MFFELSKFLNFFLISPISWMLLALTGYCLFKSKRWRRVCLAVAIGVFLVFTNSLLVSYAKYCTVQAYSTPRLQAGKCYEVAIVMGGFASMNRETGQIKYESNRADRLWEAARLWKQGTVKRLLITGDPTSVIQTDGTSTKELFIGYMNDFGIPREAFLFEQQARNTRENATYTTAMLTAEGIEAEDCLLITSASHLKRSLACFDEVGWHLDYFPVNAYESPRNINHRSFYPSWGAAIEWQELFNEWIGEVVYCLMKYV